MGSLYWGLWQRRAAAGAMLGKAAITQEAGRGRGNGLGEILTTLPSMKMGSQRWTDGEKGEQLRWLKCGCVVTR